MKDSSRAMSGVLSSVMVAGSLLVAQGCVATRDWVREQMEPVTGRVTQSETRLTESENQIGSLGGRMSGAEGKIGQIEGRVGQVEGRLGQVDAKTEQALKSLANLRLERRFVIDMKEGANFPFNSSKLPEQARKEIDGFISDLKGESGGAEGTVFLIAGHTDNVGPDDYNFALGQRRAEAVTRYLITEKNVSPLQVMTVSYGKSAPLVDNNNAQARAKNRRVEILVYKEAISSGTQASAPTGSKAENPGGSADRVSRR
ncbi:MAG TPA: OmpA family protein [Candidatus Binatia bacterium]|nr:OmpA family protein [Candidatus Binatia bacterium]